jgi:exosortase A-associated hydrolase 2
MIDVKTLDLTKINSPSDLIVEEHGFFPRDGRRLFYASFAPTAKPSTGVIFCSPFAEEKVRTVRVFVSFARALASMGVAVLCFDYFGDGDSEGNFEAATFDDRLLDTNAAFKFLKDKYALDRVGILGLRWGATLAALCSDNLKPDFRILWEPVTDSRKYFYDYLRLNVASQLLNEGKVKKNRDDLIKDLEAGGSIVVEGYVFTGQFYVQAREHELAKTAFSHRCPTLIIQIQKNTATIRQDLIDLKGALGGADVSAVPKEFEWEKTENWMPAPPVLFGTTLEFLEKNGIFGKDI